MPPKGTFGVGVRQTSPCVTQGILILFRERNGLFQVGWSLRGTEPRTRKLPQTPFRVII
jgi:hypothetical protein